MSDLTDLADEFQAGLDDALAHATDTQTVAWAAAWDDLADEWQAAVDQLAQLAADGEVSRTAILRADRVRQALEHTALRLDTLTAQHRDTATTLAAELAQAGEMAAVALIAAQLPQDTARWGRVNTKALDAIVQRTTEQITSLHQPLPRQTVIELQTVLVQTVGAGMNPRTGAARLINRVHDLVNLTRDRADTIMRTEVVDAYRAANKQTRQENRSLLAGWVWQCAYSERTCRACLSMQGTIHDVDEDGPLGHQRCRCTAVPITRPWRNLGIALPEPDREPMETGEEWLRAQPRKVQDQVLTPKGAAAWRRGDWPPEQWAVRKSSDGWRDAYYQARPPRS